MYQFLVLHSLPMDQTKH